MPRIAYHYMWMFVMFDLPTETPKQKKEYTRFRDFLKKNGYSMLQYSVYIRHIGSFEYVETHQRRIRASLPPEGFVSLIVITDRQYGMTQHYNCRELYNPVERSSQLVLF
jgi:CRISPR-associated protein Cas2